MAEISMTTGGRHAKSVKASAKHSLKVDLTPMVDLGFLLISFFIFTTTLSKPRVTSLVMPANGDSTSLSHNAALTVLACGNDLVFYYQGELTESLRNGTYGITGYSMRKGIGDIIRQRQQQMDVSVMGGRKDMMLLIKPSSSARYQNVISLLDETKINQVSKYALMDVTQEEKQVLKSQLLSY